MVLGRITRGRHTDNLGGRHSIRTNQQTPHFHAGCPSCHNPANLSWLGTGTGICWIAYSCGLVDPCKSRKTAVVVVGLYETFCSLRIWWYDADDDDDDDDVTASDSLCRYDEALCQTLVQHVCKSVGRDLLIRFVVCFLLESNLTSVRWQAHSLVLHIYRLVTHSRVATLFCRVCKAVDMYSAVNMMLVSKALRHGRC